MRKIIVVLGLGLLAFSITMAQVNHAKSIKSYAKQYRRLPIDTVIRVLPDSVLLISANGYDGFDDNNLDDTTHEDRVFNLHPDSVTFTQDDRITFINVSTAPSSHIKYLVWDEKAHRVIDPSKKKHLKKHLKKSK